MRHPDIWRHAGATSGGVDIRPFPDSRRMAHWLGKRDSVPEVWDTHTVMTLAETLPDSPSGRSTYSLTAAPTTSSTVSTAPSTPCSRAATSPHVYATYPGAHTGPFYSGANPFTRRSTISPKRLPAQPPILQP